MGSSMVEGHRHVPSHVHRTHTVKWAQSLPRQLEQQIAFPRQIPGEQFLAWIFWIIASCLPLSLASFLYLCWPSPWSFMLGYHWASRMKTHQWKKTQDWWWASRLAMKWLSTLNVLNLLHKLNLTWLRIWKTPWKTSMKLAKTNNTVTLYNIPTC